MSKKKNCYNCRHGSYESDGDYGEYTYFACEKREDNGYNNLDKNLCRDAYRQKAKVCHEPKFEAKCKSCNEVEDLVFKPKDDYQCFVCWWQEKENKNAT